MEVDALPPDVLRELFTAALRPFLDLSEYERVLELEEEQRQELGDGDES